MQTKIVLVVDPKDSNAQLLKLGVGLLEMRVDLFPQPSLAYATAQFQHRRKLKIPLLLTVRNDRKEGAQRTMSDVKKWDLLSGLMPLTDWVDIEFSSKLCIETIELARRLRKKVVVSAHNFKTTPKDMEGLYQKAKTVNADAVKFAFYAKDEDDLLRLIEFTRKHQQDNIVTMCVGPYGPLSRIILPVFGSRWVYTFLSNSTAPGQMDIQSLKRLKHQLVY